MSSWTKKKLGDVAYEVRETYEPSQDESVPYIGLEHISQGDLHLVGVGDSSDTQSTKRKFKKGDILFGSLRPYFRKVVRPSFSGVCSTDITVIRSKNGIVQSYLNYFIASQDFIDHSDKISSGSRMPRANWKVLEESEWKFPDIETQRNIASILSAFDDLIENNSRRIEILEEMAQRIYREWFVHFRYPGHENDELVDSGTELGEIPEGWEVKKLEDVADINPENISTDYKGEIEYINISGVNEGSIDETEIHDFEEAPGRAKRRVKHGDIIWSSVRPNLKAYALILNPPANQIASTGFAVIRPKKLPASFLYNFSTTEYFVQYLVNHTRGSAYPAVNVSDFKDAPILVPDKKLVEKFDEVTWSNYLQNDKLSRKNKKLQETRDLLLPKLISGKIDVEKLTVN